MPTVARRPWGLIAAVLIIDVALAASGAWMLSQGLGDRQSAKTTAPRTGAITSPETPATPGVPTATTATGAPPAASGPSSTPSK